MGLRGLKKIYNSYCLFENFMYICVVEWLTICLTFQLSSINILIINKMKGIMKQFLFCSEILTSGFFIYDIVYSNNLRDAWRSFKSRYSSKGRLRFHSASTSTRSYFKIY